MGDTRVDAHKRAVTSDKVSRRNQTNSGQSAHHGPTPDLRLSSYDALQLIARSVGNRSMVSLTRSWRTEVRGSRDIRAGAANVGLVAPHPTTIVQRILEDDVQLADLELSNPASSSVVHGDDAEAVWKLKINGADYFVKLSSDGMAVEAAATKLAGLLGVAVPRVARRKLNEPEAAGIRDAAEGGTDEATVLYMVAGIDVLLFEGIGGQDLDTLGEKGTDLTAQPGWNRQTFFTELGRMAAADFIIGIGDRFKLPGIGQAALNPGNIVQDGETGRLYGIDYDVAQGLEDVGDMEVARDEALRHILQPDTIVPLVESLVGVHNGELLKEDGWQVFVVAGVNEVKAIAEAVSSDDLAAIEGEANGRLAEYGTHIRAVLEGIKKGDIPEDPFADFEDF